MIRTVVREAPIGTTKLLPDELVSLGGHLRFGDDPFGVYPAYNVNEYGVFGDGSTDNTAALQSLIDDIPVYSTILFPPGIYQFGSQVEWNNVLRVLGSGWGTRIQPADGFAGGPIWYVQTANVVPGTWGCYEFDGLTFDGRGRTIPHTGFKVSRLSEAHLSRLNFTAIDGVAFDLYEFTRDCRFTDFTFRMCGNLTSPAMWIHENPAGVQDAVNSNDFDGFKFSYSCGRHLVIECPRENGPMRGLWFTHAKFHGTQGALATVDTEFVVDVPTETPNDLGSILVRNARGVHFNKSRVHLSAPGVALITLEDQPDIPTTNQYTQVSIDNYYGGSAGGANGGDADPRVLTAAASNQLTLTDHLLPHTGMVQATASTITGVSTSTDYFVIYVDADTIQLAASHADAVAGTAMVTGTTGTATLEPQNAHVLILTDNAQFKVGTIADYTATNRSIIVSKTTAMVTQSGDTQSDLTDATYYEGPPPDAPSEVPDADSDTKGILQLAGDLGGTAALPTVPGLASKSDTTHNHDADYADIAHTHDAATDTTAGLVELATDAEAITGTATDRVTTPANITAVLGDALDAASVALLLQSVTLDNADPAPGPGVWLRRPA